MRLPTSIIWLEDGGYILRYAFGGDDGPRIPADLGLLPRDADALDVAIREITGPDCLLWQESGVQDPSEVPVEAEEEG
jgi:hypothetical protein